MNKQPIVYKLKIHCPEWVSEIVGNIFDRMVMTGLIPKDEKTAQQLINIFTEEIEKWGERMATEKDQCESERVH